MVFVAGREMSDMMVSGCATTANVNTSNFGFTMIHEVGSQGIFHHSSTNG